MGPDYSLTPIKASLLEQMERKLGDHHSGELKRESLDAKAERIIAAELKRRHWTECDLEQCAKSAPEKLALAARLRRETTLKLPWISALSLIHISEPTRLGMISYA